MSGGFFENKQFVLDEIRDQLKEGVEKNCNLLAGASKAQQAVLTLKLETLTRQYVGFEE